MTGGGKGVRRMLTANGIVERPYPAGHYLNTGNAHSPLYVYCEDALRLDGRGLCRKCLFQREDEDGTPQCLRDSSGDGDIVCPFLELDPASKGRMTRRRKGVRI